MRRLSDESGATMVIVAVTVVALLGIGALVVDMGALFHERRILQNGADAAANAVAMDCAAGACGPYAATAATYADANAQDAASDVADVCGNGPGLPGCASPPALPSGARGYVRVSTSTSDGAGGAQVPYRLRPVLDLITGSDSEDGMTVTADATVAWGAPSSLRSELPLTISLCEYEAHTNGGTSFAPPPPYPPWPAEKILYFHNTAEAGPDCGHGPSGADLAGGFGWLQTAADCETPSSTGGWYDDSTGRPPPNSCSPAELRALRGQVVNVPVFDQTNGLTGSNGSYHVTGYAAFYLTGYSINGQYKERSLVTGSFPCGGSASCISGFFTTGVAPESPGGFGGDSLGVNVIKFVG